MSPDSSRPTDTPPDLVPVERFPHTVAWSQVGFFVFAAVAALLPLLLAIALAA